MSVGPKIKGLVARHKASVTWAYGEHTANPALGVGFQGRSKVTLSPKDLKRGATIKQV